jgi:hypothetical protein
MAEQLDLTNGLTHAEMTTIAGLAYDVEDHDVTREMKARIADALREYERLIGGVRALARAQAPEPSLLPSEVKKWCEDRIRDLTYGIEMMEVQLARGMSNRRAMIEADQSRIARLSAFLASFAVRPLSEETT